MSSQSYGAKIVIIGDYSVGKSTLIANFVEKKFRESYIPTIGVQISKRSYEIDGALVDLMIWDLAGQQSFAKVRQQFYGGADGIFIVYDLTRKSSLENVNKWYRECLKYAGSVPCVLVGNKIDLTDERVVNSDDVLNLLENNKVNFKTTIETSAKTGEKVEEAFYSLVKSVLEKHKQKSKKRRFHF